MFNENTSAFVPYIDLLQSEVNKVYDNGNTFTVERMNIKTRKTENLINYIAGTSPHTVDGFKSSFVSEEVARKIFSQYSSEPKEDKDTILRLVKLSKTLVESRNNLPTYAVISVVKYF